MLRSRPAKVVLFVLIAGAMAFFLLLRQATYVPPEMLESPGPPEGADAELALQTASQLENQVHQIEKASQRGLRAPFTMVITEAQANAYLQTHQDIGGPGSAVRNAKVRFGDGTVTMMGVLFAGGREWYVEVDGTVRPEGSSAIHFEPRDVRVGRLDLPGAIREKVMREVRAQAGRNLFELSADIEQVVVQNGRMIVTGRTR